MTHIFSEIANAEKSIFVSANAGAGKTFVLVARVLYLLLEGVDPSKILCISFTEAAAGEMKERVKKKLKEWAESEDLSKDVLLAGKSVEVFQKAKNLYAEVVLKGKMPKITTFHGFCLNIIKSFSAESSLFYSPSILTSSQEKELKKKIFKNLVLKEENRKDLLILKNAFSGFEIEEEIIPAILKGRKEEGFLKLNASKKIYEILNLQYFESLEDEFQNLEKMFLTNFLDTIKNIYHAIFKLESKGSIAINRLLMLEEFFKTHNFTSLEKALLTEKREAVKKGFITKNVEYIKEAYLQTVMALQDLWVKKGTLITAKITEVAVKITGKILHDYESEKAKMEAMDFEDIILTARQALKGEEKDFILFKLDGGINHILIDEAQDTNAIQWDVIGMLLEEFFAGHGALRGKKSLFVVGDEKQCIFGFQGSNPSALKDVLLKYKQNLTQVFLETSYRTTPLVLKVVDSIFNTNHTSFKKDGFGRVEVMPLPEAIKKETEQKMPWEETQEEGLKRQLSANITEKILEILKEGRYVESKGRIIMPCDFMLVAKARDVRLFELLKQDLKKHNIGVSFGDKLKLAESLPINDFIFLLKYLLNAKNTFALACVLKSPMFAFTDEDLEEFFLKPQVGASLPFEFYVLEEALNFGVEGFFTKAFALLGERYAVQDVREISYLFTIIADYTKQTKAPNLEGFVIYFENLVRYGEEVKMEHEEDVSSIKINTVHGSKGLESPIVFILNATEVFGRKYSKEYFAFDEDGKNIILSKKSLQCENWALLKAKQKQKDYAEYLRLLYVALTRAEEELYIFPKKDTKEEEDDEFKSWYHILQAAVPVKLTEGRLTKGKALAFAGQNTKIFAPKINVPSHAQFEEEKPATLKTTKAMQLGEAFHLALFLSDNSLSDLFIKKFTLLEKEDIDKIIAKAKKIKQTFVNIFTHNGVSEADLVFKEEGSASINVLRPDKLIIKPKEVQIIEFKLAKNAALAEEYIRQVKKYCDAVKKIYPQKVVRGFILWINEESLEEITFTNPLQAGENLELAF